MAERESRRVVMFSAEAVPYVKVGGLADVAGTLPKALERLGVRVSLVLPAFESSEAVAQEFVHFDVPMGAETVRAEIGYTTLPGSQVEVYAISGGGFFPRPSLYDDPSTREGYTDNLQRFAFFAKAGIELMRRIGNPVDVVHCHDSQTALVPALLSSEFQHDPFFARTGSLFTIHNLAYQGLYEKEDLFRTGIKPKFFYPFSPFEYWGKVNLMKAGIETADMLNTVSVTYAREIQSHPEQGCGLQGVLNNRSGVLFGIANGIDYQVWNPETDPLIPAHYSQEDLAGKQECKCRLLQKMGLPIPAGRTPLIGIISRLADQKGFDLIGEAIEEIAALDIQMIVLGTGQAKYHELLEGISSRYPKKIAAELRFDNELAHQIEAGSDMFLMPSRYEPCGLNQLYSLRYGTIPIVRSTGGLADTVCAYRAGSDTGTGFVFYNYSAMEMVETIKRAHAAFQDAKRWGGLMMRAMQERWSWDASAARYLDLYERVHQIKHALKKYADS